MSIGLTTGLICSADIALPLGHIPWILYFIPLALSFQMRNRQAPLPFAALCSLLICAGFVFSPPGTSLSTATFNRLTGVMTLWFVAWFLVRLRIRQDKLGQTEERWQILAHHTHDILWEWDITTDRHWWSANARALFNLDSESEPSIRAWASRLHPDERPRVTENVQRAIAGSDSGWADEYRFRTADGSYRSYFDRGTILRTPDGKAVRMIGAMIDVTDRKERENALAFFRSLLDQATDAIEIIDPASARFLDCNEPAHADLGYTREEFLQLSVFDIAPHFDPEVWRERIRSMPPQGSVPTESIHRRKDGSTFPVEVSCRLVHLDRPYILAIVRDVSVRKSTEQALRLSEQRYRDLVERIDGIVWEADASTFQFTFVSGHAETLLGYPVQQWLDDPQFWPNHLHPDDRAAAIQYCHDHTARGAAHSFEYRMIAADGRTVWVYDSVTVSLMDGKAQTLQGVILDITERKHIEAALRESEERFRQAYHHASLGISTADLAGHISQVNPAICAILGYEEGELRGRTFQSLTHPDDLPANLERVKSLLDGRATRQEFEKRYIRKDGTHVWATVSISLIRSAEGIPSHLLAMVRDITDRKLAEEAARHRQQELRLLLEEFPAILWTMSPDLHFTSSTGRGLTTLGLAPDEIVGQSLEQFMTGLGALPPILEQHQRALKGDRVTLELATNVATFHTHVEPRFDGHGRIVGTIGVAMDITDRKRNEEALRMSTKRLQLALRTSEMGVWEWDAASDRIYWSEECFSIFGLRSFEGTLQAFRQLVHPDHREAFSDALEYAIAAHTPVTLEFQFIRSDGAVRWASNLGQATYDQAGQVIRFTGTVQDVTARKAAETELQQAYDRLRDATLRLTQAEEFERGRISRELHDEFGQALTALQFDLFSLRKRLESDSIPRHDPAVLNRISTMITLTERTMAAIHYMTTILRPAMLDELGLFPALQASVDEFSFRTGINCEFTAGPDRAATPVDSDIATAAYRIMQELLTNVIRHANASHVNIVLDIQDGQLELEFQDNGIGITPNQIDATTSYGIQGMQERAALLGGSFTITGRPGTGTRAGLTLPLTRQQAMQPRHD
ncbi:MAG: PAS domain S-box protein [Nitrospiraceae bacterium]